MRAFPGFLLFHTEALHQGVRGEGVLSDSAHWLRSFEQPALRFVPVSAC